MVLIISQKYPPHRPENLLNRLFSDPGVVNYHGLSQVGLNRTSSCWHMHCQCANWRAIFTDVGWLPYWHCCDWSYKQRSWPMSIFGIEHLRVRSLDKNQTHVPSSNSTCKIRELGSFWIRVCWKMLLKRAAKTNLPKLGLRICFKIVWSS